MIELKEIAEHAHYLGISEEIRSIIRKKWLEYSKLNYDFGAIKREIKNEFKKEINKMPEKK